MAAPIVTYYDEKGTTQLTEWNIGEIDAGTESDHLKLTVWNNKGGSEAVSHMKNVSVTVVNELGAETGGNGDVAVAGAWIHVKVNGGEDTPLGGSANTAKVNAVGVDSDTDGYIIKGDANDGTIANSTVNYANYELWAVIPPNAPEGDKPVRIRTSYSYT